MQIFEIPPSSTIKAKEILSVEPITNTKIKKLK